MQAQRLCAWLVLGSQTAFTRSCGDSDPDQSGLGDLILSLKGAGSGWPAGVTPGQIVADGSIIVTGPGPSAQVGEYRLQRSVDPNKLAFSSSSVGGFWIDLTGLEGDGAYVPLIIEPRRLTVEILTPSATYVYGNPQPLVKLDGVVNNDLVYPLASLTLEGAGTGEDVSLSAVDGVPGEFALPASIERGRYVYAITGISSSDGRASNYELELTGSETGSLEITPRLLTYTISAHSRVYGSTDLPAVSFGGDGVAS